MGVPPVLDLDEKGSENGSYDSNGAKDQRQENGPQPSEDSALLA